MEYTILEKIITQMGIPGIGFAFLGYFLKRYFDEAKESRVLREKELEKDNKDITKLCEKIDKMADAIQDFATIQVQKSTILEKDVTDIKDMYIRIANKQDVIREQVQETNTNTKLCPRVSEERRRKDDN